MFINVLRGNLARRLQLLKQLGRNHEAAFAVADSNIVDVAHLAARKPGAQIRRHARAHQAALVTADLVERKRGARVIHGADVAIRHQAQLHERLETVANAQHQAVTVLQQITHSFGHFRSAEERGDELRRTIGLVAARKTARQHDNLALANKLRQTLRAFGNGSRRQVVDNERRGSGTRALERMSGVILAVRAREHGNNHARLGNLAREHMRSSSCIADRLNGFARLAVRIHRLKLAFPGFLQLGQAHVRVTRREHIIAGRRTNFHHAQRLSGGGQRGIRRQFYQEAAIRGNEQLVSREIARKRNAQLVANAHLEQGFCQAAIACRGHGQRVTRGRKGFHGVKRFLHTLDLRHNAIFLVRRRNQHHAVSCSLELGRHNAVHVSAGRSEADKRGRHVQVLKAAGHGVLAANGANAQVNLRHKRTQKRRRRFAPARGIFAQAAEVLLKREVCILA